MDSSCSHKCLNLHVLAHVDIWFCCTRALSVSDMFALAGCSWPLYAGLVNGGRPSQIKECGGVLCSSRHASQPLLDVLLKLPTLTDRNSPALFLKLRQVVGHPAIPSRIEIIFSAIEISVLGGLRRFLLHLCRLMEYRTLYLDMNGTSFFRSRGMGRRRQQVPLETTRFVWFLHRCLHRYSVNLILSYHGRYIDSAEVQRLLELTDDMHLE